MAFPFKTGGDFYNCEAQRMRLHNLGANPTETATGLMYFNTGASNLGKHAVVHDGTNFKALAFVDEIATNTAFAELAERVDDLETALGTDEKDVLDTWEEVKTFLASIKESDGDLMTMLDDKLSKSKSGTINGDGNSDVLTLNADSNCYMYFKVKGNTKAAVGYYNNFTFLSSEIANGARLGITDNGTPEFRTASNTHTLLHSGNIGDYTIRYHGNKGAIDFNNELNNGLQYVSSSSSNGGKEYDIMLSTFITDSAWQLVGGRSGELRYRGGVGTASGWGPWKTIAFTDSDITGNAGSADVIAKTYENESINYANNESKIRLINGTASNSTDLGFPKQYTSGISVISNYVGWQMVSFGSDSIPNPYYRAVTDKGVWGFWKQLAFLDDNVASAQALKHSNGAVGAVVNSSGNVLIGTTTDNGAKLQVDGSSHFLSYIGASTEIQLGSRIPKSTMIGADKFGLQVWGQGDGITRMQVGRIDGQATAYDLYLQPLGGNVRIFGNLIVDGEVSAGGVGQEGESGDGGAEVISQQLASGQSTYTITNTIKRSDIAVSLYEANVINGQTIWSLCLADIEVTNETITVTFGSATSVNHKLVAVG